MQRREFLTAAGGLAGLAALRGLHAAGPDRPNILIFYADDLGYADTAVYGCTDIPTPNIDALAKSGVRFSNGYVSGCVCSPSRAGLMTGRYQQRSGLDANVEGKPSPSDRGPRMLDIDQTTFAQRMKALGYRTGIVGKWHLGMSEGYRPFDRGFDEFFGYYPASIGQDDAVLFRGKDALPKPENWMESFCTEARSFIDRNRRSPFLLYLPFSAVHAQHLGVPPWDARVDASVPAKRKKYAADIIQMDDVIGRVMRTIRDSGLEERTLVFFISDNGGSGGAASNAPLSGTKWTLWEGGIRVPFIAQWKGHIPPGRVVDHPVMQIDVLPTALAAAGLTAKPQELDGTDLMPLIGGAAPQRALFWRFGIQYAVRRGNWKLVKPHIDMKPRLHDLAADIAEKNDLAGSHPETVRELQSLWDAWNAKNEPPRWIDNRWNGDGGHGKRTKKRSKKEEDENDKD